MRMSLAVHPRHWRLSTVAIVTAAVLASATLGTVGALAQDAPAAHGPMDGMHGGPGRGLERFKAKLKLTAEQSALWDQAAEKMRPPADMRERMRAEHDQYMTALMDPSFDPRKWLDAQDKEKAERDAHMKEVRTAWLAVWDHLDAAQRTQVREFLVKRALHGFWHGGGRGRGGPPPQDMPNAAPPAKQ